MIGKQVKGNCYVHVTALAALAPDLRERVRSAAARANLTQETDFNVVKIGDEGRRISFLFYEDFFDHPFPTLRHSCVVDLVSGRLKRLRYDRSDNPPILHRKELLLPPNHPHTPLFASLTQQLEAAGLFRDARRIGLAREWQARLHAAGYAVREHQLVVFNDVASLDPSATASLARHRTALQRYALSTPMQALHRHGYLDGARTIFDYGCGKGDDIRILRQNEIDATGWDPHFAPDAPLTRADIVNLGFVLNVIEDPAERARALQSAYALAEQLLVVAVMLTGRTAANGETFGDGVRTSRNTFQKYFTQHELREYLSSALEKEPVAVGPGVFFVFKEEEEEQRFFAHRMRNRDGLDRLISHVPKPTRAEREQVFYDAHRSLFEELWDTWLALGRKPELGEIADRAEIETVCGSLAKALRFLERFHGTDSTAIAFRARKEDLTVYFALQQFEHRTPYTTLAEELRRDIRTFFGSYQNAQVEARQLLFSAGDRKLVRRLCREAAANGLGWLEKERAFYLHTSLVERLPAVLRVYVGCASYLFGDVTSADLIKIHSDSAKITLLSFDDFEGKPLPRLVERIKIRFRDQESERFTYGATYEPPYLYRKSRFITEDFPHYTEQVAFEQALEARRLFDFTDGHGPSPQAFEATLNAARLTIDGFELKVSHALPSLDEPCGRHLTFRDVIACGKTQASVGIANLPEQPDTYLALTELALHVLDPVIEYFGDIMLTYGFCSRALAKQIPERIAPALDQHAGHEVNTRGNPICPRLGAAVDFLVTDESMLEVAQWIVRHTPFDRLYFYGDDRPLHVSHGPEHKREIVVMKCGRTGRLVPQVMGTEMFASLAPSAFTEETALTSREAAAKAE